MLKQKSTQFADKAELQNLKNPKLWYCYDTVNEDGSVWNSHLLAFSLENREMSIQA